MSQSNPFMVGGVFYMYFNLSQSSKKCADYGGEYLLVKS